MQSATRSTRRQAIFVCLLVAATALACAALLGATVLVPAPPAVLPLVILVCIGWPMLAALELPRAAAVLRATRRAARADVAVLAALRRELDGLPETDHPLGL